MCDVIPPVYQTSCGTWSTEQLVLKYFPTNRSKLVGPLTRCLSQNLKTAEIIAEWSCTLYPKHMACGHSILKRCYWTVCRQSMERSPLSWATNPTDSSPLRITNWYCWRSGFMDSSGILPTLPADPPSLASRAKYHRPTPWLLPQSILPRVLVEGEMSGGGSRPFIPPDHMQPFVFICIVTAGRLRLGSCNQYRFIWNKPYLLVLLYSNRPLNFLMYAC